MSESIAMGLHGRSPMKGFFFGYSNSKFSKSDTLFSTNFIGLSVSS